MLLHALVGLLEPRRELAAHLGRGHLHRALDQLAPVHVVEVVVEAERVDLLDVLDCVLPLLDQPVEAALDDVLGAAARLEELAHRVVTHHRELLRSFWPR